MPAPTIGITEAVRIEVLRVTIALGDGRSIVQFLSLHGKVVDVQAPMAATELRGFAG